jgi:integrase
LKVQLGARSPKTVNNVLTVLNVLLKKAVEWGVVAVLPCGIRLLRVPKSVAQFHDFDQFEKLVESAARLNWRTHLIVLLRGEAGLRCGEMMALEWGDIDFPKRQLCVQRSQWKQHVTEPKGDDYGTWH